MHREHTSDGATTFGSGSVDSIPLSSSATHETRERDGATRRGSDAAPVAENSPAAGPNGHAAATDAAGEGSKKRRRRGRRGGKGRAKAAAGEATAAEAPQGAGGEASAPAAAKTAPAIPAKEPQRQQGGRPEEGRQAKDGARDGSGA
ncbi:MAG TPA: hypothetical protein VGD74_12755, partial [Vulgatibacter sp.]